MCSLTCPPVFPFSKVFLRWVWSSMAFWSISTQLFLSASFLWTDKFSLNHQNTVHIQCFLTLSAPSYPKLHIATLQSNLSIIASFWLNWWLKSTLVLFSEVFFKAPKEFKYELGKLDSILKFNRYKSNFPCQSHSLCYHHERALYADDVELCLEVVPLWLADLQFKLRDRHIWREIKDYKHVK